MAVTDPDLTSVEQKVTKLKARLKASAPSIIVLYSSLRSASRYFTAMERHPQAPTPIEFGSNFQVRYAQLAQKNPSLHDGAILVKKGTPMQVTHWSCRLFPPTKAFAYRPNMGSSYHTALQFSTIDGVTGVVAISGGDVLTFVNGEELA